MKADSKTLRLFGHWEDVRIQGTDRTYRIYACHPLDRILTIALILAVWAAVFLFFFCRTPEPRGIGVLLRGLGVIYLPAEIGPFIRLFLFCQLKQISSRFLFYKIICIHKLNIFSSCLHNPFIS